MESTEAAITKAEALEAWLFPSSNGVFVTKVNQLEVVACGERRDVAVENGLSALNHHETRRN
jgi:hypothetical protein